MPRTPAANWPRLPQSYRPQQSQCCGPCWHMVDQRHASRHTPDALTGIAAIQHIHRAGTHELTGFGQVANQSEQHGPSQTEPSIQPTMKHTSTPAHAYCTANCSTLNGRRGKSEGGHRIKTMPGPLSQRRPGRWLISTLKAVRITVKWWLNCRKPSVTYKIPTAHKRSG